MGMKWLDLSGHGYRVMQAYKNGRHLIVLYNGNTPPEDLGYEEDLAEHGMRPFRSGWAAPATPQLQNFLKSLPRARIVNLGYSDLNTLFYGDVPAWLRERVQARIEEKPDARQSAHRAIRRDGSAPLGKVSAEPVRNTEGLREVGEPVVAGESPGDSPSSAADMRDHVERARGTDAGTGSAGGDGAQASGGSGAARTDSAAGRSRSDRSLAQHGGNNPAHFYFTNEADRDGGFAAAERAADNLAAIRCIQDLVESGREPTEDDRKILARYCGWGGLSAVFAPRYDEPQWRADARAALKALLSEDHYESLSETVTDSFYTPPALSKAIWTVVQDMGFDGGKVGDPCAGTGAFPGNAPRDLVDKSHFLLAEKDPIVGQILKHLYPDAAVHTNGFENVRIPDNFLDLVISNAPFGDYTMSEAAYDKYGLKIHDHFLVKSLDKVRPGGIVAMITSTGTLDKLSGKARILLHERGNLLGAVRLPNGTFDAQSGTKAGADIVFFQRHLRSTQMALVPEEIGADAESWIQSGPLPEYKTYEGRSPWAQPYKGQINKYFLDNPSQVLGDFTLARGEMGREVMTVQAPEGFDLAVAVIDAAKNFKAPERPATDEAPLPAGDEGDMTVGIDQDEASVTSEYAEIMDARLGPGSYVLMEDGQVGQVTEHQNEDGQWRVDANPKLKGKPLERMKDMISVRDAMNVVFQAQINLGVSDTPEYLAARESLNEAYESFVGKHGPLNLPANRRVFLHDPESGRLAALEIYNERKKTAKKADIFTQRILGIRLAETVPETPHDGLLVCLRERARVDFQKIGALIGKPGPEVRESLLESGEVFIDPVTEQPVIQARYLSGNVREKLADARDAAQMISEVYDANIAALEKVLPEDLKPGDISVTLGASWVPAEDMQAFITDLLGVDPNDQWLEVSYNSALNAWDISAGAHQKVGIAATKTWGTRVKNRDAVSLIERACNNKSIDVYETINEKRVKNDRETMLAQQKLREIQTRFEEWLWEDPERQARLVRLYNDTYNNWVKPEYDGSHLTFPGMSQSITMRQHQKNGVWRAIMEGKVLFGHGVGSGKTFTQIATAMEAKRLGLAAKPLQVVPNHMLEQFEREARQLYPNAKILVVGKEDLSKKRRQVFMGKVANNNGDLVIITRESFGKLQLDAASVKQILYEEKSRLSMAAMADGDTSKQAARAKKRLESKLKKIIQDASKDAGMTLGDMGVDWIQIDESHNFKNLDAEVGGTTFDTGISGAQRSLDLFLKTRWLDNLRGDGKGLVFASATPISNNILETYVIQKYLQQNQLESMGIHRVDGWANLFLKPVEQWEPSPSGEGFRLRVRYKLTNAPEVMGMLLQVMDLVSCDEAGLDRPEVETVREQAGLSEIRQNYMRGLEKRVTALRKGNVDPSVDNILKIVSEGRKLSLDPGLLGLGRSEPEGFSKVRMCIDNALKEYRESEEIKGTQLIFCEQGTPGNQTFELYRHIKDELIAGGVPADQVTFIQEAKSDAAKADLFARVRAGEARFMLGSTATMGEGTNVQDRIVAWHHLDAPWRPSDITQRDGRGERQGNMNTHCRRYIYTTEDSFDLFMWSLMDTKAKLFTRVLAGDASVREFDDAVDPTFAETAAIVSSNPLIKEKLEIDQRLALLSAMYGRWKNDQYDLNYRIGFLEEQIESRNKVLAMKEEMLERLSRTDEKELSLWRLNLKPYGLDSEYKGKREGLYKVLKKLMESQQITEVTGISYAGLPVILRRFEYTDIDGKTRWGNRFVVEISGHADEYKMGADVESELNLAMIDIRIAKIKKWNAEAHVEIEESREEMTKPFEHAEELMKVREQSEALTLALAQAESDGDDEAVVTDDDLEQVFA